MLLPELSLVVESGDSSLAALCGLLVLLTSLVVEHGPQGARASVAVAHKLSSCSFQALKHRFSPWSGDIPHAAEQLTKLVHHSY